VFIVGPRRRFRGDNKGRLWTVGVSNRRTSLEFRSYKGTAVWPEEDLVDFVCDVTRAVVHRYWVCVI
jgi:REP element-mobilizing transposase RayT